ncbi:MAG: type II toxin-antitoxin system RelB/DinJ family antitoxin [Balneolales bacterium]
MLIKQVKLQQGLPFALRIPNEETDKTIREAKNRKKLKKVQSPDELFEDLDI